jgi:hypothetical protein
MRIIIWIMLCLPAIASALNYQQLESALWHLYPAGGWATRDNAVTQVPHGDIPDAATLEAAYAASQTPEAIAARAAAALRAEAETILDTDANARQAVLDVLAQVQAVAALGVVIEDWTFQGVEAALRAAIAAEADLGKKLALLEAGTMLRARWDRIIYHAGDMRAAYRLWPALVELATAPEPEE